MNLRFPPLIQSITKLIPGFYKENYPKVLLAVLVILTGFWGWAFYQYALRPATSPLDVRLPPTTLPEDLLNEVLKDVKARREQFLNPAFEPIRDPFVVPAPSPSDEELNERGGL